jgi:hypothetical protein
MMLALIERHQRFATTALTFSYISRTASSPRFGEMDLVSGTTSFAQLAPPAIPRDRATLRLIIAPAAKKLGFHFPGFGWHSFRRQTLTLMQEEGATLFEAMAQAGHSRPTMTSEYTVIGIDRQELAIRRLQNRLFGEDWE